MSRAIIFFEVDVKADHPAVAGFTKTFASDPAAALAGLLDAGGPPENVNVQLAGDNKRVVLVEPDPVSNELAEMARVDADTGG